MQIGEVIRKYRKQKKMTQEEMARRLGVTAPAVNKWEGGSSQPDISLLAPIARLLGITLEELLSFQEELTQKEIAYYVKELDKRLENGEYGEAFEWAKSLWQEHPNCSQLLWQLTLILDTGRKLRQIEEDSLELQIEINYRRALEEGDVKTRKGAADSLFMFYMNREQYDKAEECLTYLAEEDSLRKIHQAHLCLKKGMRQEACKIYEELLLSEYNVLNVVLYMLYLNAMEQEEYGEAVQYLDKRSKLAAIFEMGRFHEISGYLEYYAKEKNVEKTLRIAKEMMSSIETMGSITNTPLYRHLERKERDKTFYERFRQDLISGFRDEETFGYMRECSEWNEMLRKDFSQIAERNTECFK